MDTTPIPKAKRLKAKEIEARYGMPLEQVLVTKFNSLGTLTAVAKELGVTQSSVSLWLKHLKYKVQTKVTKTVTLIKL